MFEKTYEQREEEDLAEIEAALKELKRAQTSPAPVAKPYPDWMLESIAQFKTALTGGARADNGRYCLCREFDKWGECPHTDYLINQTKEYQHV